MGTQGVVMNAAGSQRSPQIANEAWAEYRGVRMGLGKRAPADSDGGVCCVLLEIASGGGSLRCC